MTAQKSMNITPAIRGGLKELLDAHFSENIKNLHTQIPAKVLKVDYEKGWVDVQPLIKNPDKKDIFTGEITEYDYPPVYEVPIKVISAGRGKASITMPIKIGDVGKLEFSERDTDTFLNTSGNSVQPSNNINVLGQEGKPYRLCFEGEFFTPSSSLSIDPENIIINNEKSTITLKPSGEVVINFSGYSVTCNPNSGDVVHNSGAKITGTGDMVTAKGYSLNALYEKTWSHVHSGVSSGPNNTGDIA